MTETEQEAARFWANVDRAEGDGCWVWKTTAASGRYGSFALHGKVLSTHRAAYILTHGSIPKGMLVCHRCDNRPCVRPDHLFTGTYQDNSDDCKTKGRLRNGIKGQPQPHPITGKRRMELICSPRDLAMLDEIAVGLGTKSRTATIRTLINNEATREAARQTRRTARATLGAPAGGGEENPPR